MPTLIPRPFRLAPVSGRKRGALQRAAVRVWCRRSGVAGHFERNRSSVVRRTPRGLRALEHLVGRGHAPRQIIRCRTAMLRHRGSSPTMPALMETRAPPPPASRFGRMIPELARRSTKREVVKGYEYARGEFVTFTAEELKALDVESSKIIDLEKFVPGGGIDPVYFDSSYYLYPDGPVAVDGIAVRHRIIWRGAWPRPTRCSRARRPRGVRRTTDERLRSKCPATPDRRHQTRTHKGRVRVDLTR
jgi:hypothetical protein